MMTTAEVLRGARALLSSPERWTQGQATETRDGVVVARCLVEAMNEAGRYARMSIQRDAAKALYGVANGVAAPDGGFLSVWNDAPGRTYEEVIAVLDRAIEVAEG